MSATDGSGKPALAIGVLGPLEVFRGENRLTLGGTKQRTVLAVLALSPGRVVSTDRLISALWGEEPPSGALATLQVYVSNVRRVLADPSGDSLSQLLIRRAPGYLLEVAADCVDLGRFRALVATARQRAVPDLAGVHLLREALRLWRADALEDLASDRMDAWLAPVAAERRAAHELCLDFELTLGRAREILGELETLVGGNPLDEGLAARLMRALYQAGRQADALRIYRRTRDVLADELGLEPSAELRELEGAILTQSPTLTPAAVPKRRADVTTVRWRPDSESTAYLSTDQGGRIPLRNSRSILGRGDDCDVSLSHVSVSRRHVVIEQTNPGAHELIDLGSTNGTRVNGDVLTAGQPHPLCDGDTVELGAETFTFHSPA